MGPLAASAEILTLAARHTDKMLTPKNLSFSIFRLPCIRILRLDAAGRVTELCDWTQREVGDG
jgi:hypothetical protein